jgi:hypothetical protein
MDFGAFRHCILTAPAPGAFRGRLVSDGQEGQRVIKLLQRHRSRVNRRAFLRGAGGVAVGLPFLESLPERSAWAAGDEPVFSLFICAVDGVVPPHFFPDSVGSLSVDSLAAAAKATSALAAHADELLFVKGVNWPLAAPSGEAHAQGLCMAFTAVKPTGSSADAVASGPSADWVIAEKVQPGVPPLTLYAGNRRNGYIAERISFSAAGATTAAQDNPYVLYQQLMGLVAPDGTPTPGSEEAMALLAESRNSVHDVVRDELHGLMSNSRLSSDDKQRLQQHFDSIRDLEVTMGGMGGDLVERCSWDGVEISQLQALETFVYDRYGQIEDIVRLHMSLVALAFACNYNRTATLQWGDGTDQTIYDVPSNERGWPFNHVCHRAPSDGQAGDDPLAEQAHAEIDVVRMQTLAAGLDHFKARGLADRSFVLWTNGFTDCPGHSFRSVPHIIWGNGGGHLRQGAYVDAGGVTNNQLLNSLITAAIQDTGEVMETFGEGTPGRLGVVLA